MKLNPDTLAIIDQRLVPAVKPLRGRLPVGRQCDSAPPRGVVAGGGWKEGRDA